MGHRAGVVAAVGWLAASLALTVAGADADAFASTASGVAHGRVWTLLTSGLPVSQYPYAELAGCAIAVAVALALLGGVRFWIVALASHVGSALVVYAGIGAVWLIAPHVVADIAVEPDYGISAVWLGVVGAIAVVLHRDGRRRAALIIAGTAIAATLAAIAVSDELPFAEHLAALVIGALTARVLLRQAAASRSRDDRPTRNSGSWPSARMAASPVRAKASGPS